MDISSCTCSVCFGNTISTDETKYIEEQSCSECDGVICRSCRRALIRTRRGTTCPLCRALLSEGEAKRILEPAVADFRTDMIDIIDDETSIPSNEIVFRTLVRLCRRGNDWRAEFEKFRDSVRAPSSPFARRRSLLIWHRLLKSIETYMNVKGAQRREMMQENSVKDLYPFSFEDAFVGKSPPRPTSIEGFDPHTLSACQTKLSQLSYPYATRDLNESFAVEDAVVYVEERVLRRLNAQRRALLRKYGDGWNQIFLKYLKKLSCPVHVLNSSKPQRLYWLLREATRRT